MKDLTEYDLIQIEHRAILIEAAATRCHSSCDASKLAEDIARDIRQLVASVRSRKCE